MYGGGTLRITGVRAGTPSIGEAKRYLIFFLIRPCLPWGFGCCVHEWDSHWGSMGLWLAVTIVEVTVGVDFDWYHESLIIDRHNSYHQRQVKEVFHVLSVLYSEWAT